MDENDSGLAENFDVFQHKDSNKKSKRKKKSPKKYEEEDNDFVHGDEVRHDSNVIIVGSSENVKENENFDADTNSVVKKKKKKKNQTEKYEENEEDADNQCQKTTQMDSKTEQEVINDSRAELFRARSHDNLDEVDGTKLPTTKKSKKKIKKKKKELPASGGSEEEYEEDKKSKKKKKKKRNKTMPTTCEDEDPHGEYNHFPRQLPPIRGNGHVSKLQPIELRESKFTFSSSLWKENYNFTKVGI